MSEPTQRNAATGHTFGDGDGVRAAIESAGLTCAEFQILALEDLDTDDENGDALIETWRVLQDH
jgi:sugar phosphate isomerase/epimerase